MIRTRRYVKKQAKAITRRRLNAKERHERQQRQAQRDIDALRQGQYSIFAGFYYGLRGACIV